MGLTPMPDELADGLRGEGIVIVAAAGLTLAMIAYLHYKWVTNPTGMTSTEKRLWNEIRN